MAGLAHLRRHGVGAEHAGDRARRERSPRSGRLCLPARRSGLIRVLDLLILKEDDDGALEAFEVSDLDESELGELRLYETGLAMVLSEQDVKDVAEAIEQGSSAAVLVWENLWAAPFGTAVRRGAGRRPAGAGPAGPRRRGERRSRFG